MPSTQQRKFLNYFNAKKIIHKEKIKNANPGWRIYQKNKTRWNIPSQPDVYYKNKGWKSWEDFLGPSYVKKGINQKGSYVDFNKAKYFIKKMNLGSAAEWNKFAKSKRRPKNIPSHPQIIYLNKGWKGWPDFLGKKTNG